uniref:ATPase AAA-type core domain-containing protein n=1 Tax=Dendroctonus ponderosae TaxID=77166 RepID=A0AAR5Q5M1_DENPD
MSHKYYDEQFCEIQDCLVATLNSEPAQADRRENRQLLAGLYVRYITIANKLGTCVDQMVQPQKRLLLRKLLEATLGRILELKTDLVEADLSEWTHCGDILEDLRITPNDSELEIPACFRREREQEINCRKGVIDDVLNKLGFTDEVDERLPMSEQQAILVIQTHERARQGRLRAQFMKEIRSMKDKNKPVVTESEGDEQQLGVNLAAAVKIQKIWRGYMARRATRRQKLQEMLLIGMIPPPKKRNEEIEKDLENQERRRQLQIQRQEEYSQDIKKIRSHLEKTQRGPVLEQLSDQVRNWFHEFKAQTGTIPEYTGSERSASRQMPSRQGTDSETSKSTPGSSKESKMTKTRASKSGKEPKAAEDVEDEEDWRCKAIVSTFAPELNVRKEEYEEWWRNKDESSNPRQHHYKHIIEHEQMTEMENELRKVVDEMMKAELMLLQDAFDKDRGHKSKKKSSKKSRKAMKKGKKKKEKDLTPDRTTQSLFEELVANGIIKRYPEVWMQDFRGERSFHPPAAHNRGKEPPFDLGDIRQVLTEYCVVPLLSARLHRNTPPIKSVLLAGPKGSGKDMLLHAICNEIGAVLFDLTPANIVGKYPGKSGLIMLIHLVVKVSRLLQPSVIYMDNAERPFVKKVPKTDRTDPKRLKKDLPKMVKNFGTEDRVILIGATNCPWESDQKLLQQVYQKFLIIPRPKYSSRYASSRILAAFGRDTPNDRIKYAIWTHLLNRHMPVSWKFDTSVVSKISDGYTVGSIVSTVKEVITVKRMLQLRIHPLSPLELVNALCKRTPVYKEEDEALELWWSKVPMVRRRLRAVEMLIEEEEEMMAKQANAKKK